MGRRGRRATPIMGGGHQRCGTARLGPPHLEQPHCLVKALQVGFAPVAEEIFLALASGLPQGVTRVCRRTPARESLLAWRAHRCPFP
jgi:hypothetical protein